MFLLSFDLPSAVIRPAQGSKLNEKAAIRKIEGTYLEELLRSAKLV